MLRQLVIHTDIFFHHRIGVCRRVTEHLEQQRLDLAFVDGKGSAGIRAVFDLAGAEPFTVLSAALVLGFPAVVGLSALRTPQLSSQEIGVVANTLPRFHVLAALFQHGIGLIPNFFRYDCGDNFSCFILEHDPFLRREEFLLLREHIHDLDLVANVVALVFGI